MDDTPADLKKIQWSVFDKLTAEETTVTQQPFKDTTATERNDCHFKFRPQQTMIFLSFSTAEKFRN